MIIVDFCNKKGIQIETTMAYTSQQNGKAERLNRTLIEKVRTLLADSNFDKNMWGEAVYASAYIVNRLPTVNGKIPAEIWSGETPDYKKLRTFGTEAYVYINKEHRGNKISEKSKKFCILGFCNNGY